MGVFDIGRGATFTGPKDLDLFSATEGLSKLADTSSNLSQRQRSALREFKPYVDEVTGIELYSPALITQYQSILSNEYDLTPEAVDRAMGLYMQSGDPQVVTQLAGQVQKATSDPRIREIVRKDTFGSTRAKDKHKYGYVAPIFDRAIQDYMEEGDISGLEINYDQLDLEAYFDKIKDRYTTTSRDTKIDKRALTSYAVDLAKEDREKAVEQVMSRISEDPNFLAQLETLAINSGIQTRDEEGALTPEFENFSTQYIERELGNFGESKEPRVSKTYAPTKLSDEAIQQMIASGEITPEEAEEMEGVSSPGKNVYTDEDVTKELERLGKEDNPVNRSIMEAALKNGKLPDFGDKEGKPNRSGKPTKAEKTVELQEELSNEDNDYSYIDDYNVLRFVDRMNNKYGINIPPDTAEEAYKKFKERGERKFVDRWEEGLYEDKYGSEETAETGTEDTSDDFDVDLNAGLEEETTRIEEAYGSMGDDFKYKGKSGEEAKAAAIKDVAENNKSAGEILEEEAKTWGNRKWKLKDGVREQDISSNSKKIYNRVISELGYEDADITISSGERNKGHTHADALDLTISDDSVAMVKEMLLDYRKAEEVIGKTSGVKDNILLIESKTQTGLEALARRFGVDLEEFETGSDTSGRKYYLFNNKIALTVNPHATGNHIHIGPARSGSDFEKSFAAGSKADEHKAKQAAAKASSMPKIDFSKYLNK